MINTGEETPPLKNKEYGTQDNLGGNTQEISKNLGRNGLRS